MSCPVKDTLTSYLIKEKIIGKNNKVLVGSEELFDSLEVLNNYAKNEFGVEENILKLKNITEDGLQYTSIEVDDKIAFEIDSKKGLYDSEASNKFRKTPPSGDNFVEIIPLLHIISYLESTRLSSNLTQLSYSSLATPNFVPFLYHAHI